MTINKYLLISDLSNTWEREVKNENDKEEYVVGRVLQKLDSNVWKAAAPPKTPVPEYTSSGFTTVLRSLGNILWLSFELLFYTRFLGTNVGIGEKIKHLLPSDLSDKGLRLTSASPTLHLVTISPLSSRPCCHSQSRTEQESEYMLVCLWPPHNRNLSPMTPETARDLSSSMSWICIEDKRREELLLKLLNK